MKRARDGTEIEEKVAEVGAEPRDVIDEGVVRNIVDFLGPVRSTTDAVTEIEEDATDKKKAADSKKAAKSIDLLDDEVLHNIAEFIGKGHFRMIAGTNRRFRDVYKRVDPSCTTLAEVMVETVAGAKVFCEEANPRSYFDMPTAKTFFYQRDASRYHFYVSAVDFVCKVAAFKGRLTVLQWLKDQNFAFNTDACAYAALGGQLGIVQWLKSNDCPWDARTCSVAAYGGYLEVLQWARENGCPWDEHTCALAAAGGHFNPIEMVRSPCPWGEHTYQVSPNNHLEVLQWARLNGCPWNKDTRVQASLNGRTDIERWAQMNGCPSDLDFFFPSAEAWNSHRSPLEIAWRLFFGID